MPAAAMLEARAAYAELGERALLSQIAHAATATPAKIAKPVANSRIGVALSFSG